MIDASLGDILYVLNPTFSSELIKRLETNARESRAFDGTMYTPGVVGKYPVMLYLTVSESLPLVSSVADPDLRRIHMLLGLPDPLVRDTDPDVLVRDTDPDLDPSIIKQK